MESKRCLNCNDKLSKVQRFCASCGQSTLTHRFTIASFFHEGFHAITHADKGIFYLLKELALRPGVVAREYIYGKRKKYYNPFTFFLLLMALYVFVNTFISANEISVNKAVPVEIAQIKEPRVKELRIAEYKRVLVAKDFATKRGNVIAMLAIPFFAFFFWLIYYRRGFNYAEHLVANLMFVTFANLAFTLVVFPLQGVLKETSWEPLLTLVGFLLQAFYFTLAYKGFMQLKSVWSVVKMAFLSIVVIMLWVIFTMSAMAIYITQNLHFYEYFKHMGR